METIDELLVEATAAAERFWFVRELQIIDRTDSTTTVHFVIGSDLFVQVFLSQRTGRLNLALVGPSVGFTVGIANEVVGIDTPSKTRKRTRSH